MGSHLTKGSVGKKSISKNMTRNFLFGIILSICAISNICAQTKAAAPFGPVPSVNQIRWQQMEYYSFVHFSLNTWTDQSWGYGDEDVKLFNPEKLDCRQWARICKQSGMNGIIITANLLQVSDVGTSYLMADAINIKYRAL